MVDADAPGSMEYGVDMLDCPLLVVLGHDSCGAVAAASAVLEDGMVPSASSGCSRRRPPGRVSPDEILAEHVIRFVDLQLERSRVLADQVGAGRTAVGRLCYRLADGSARVVAVRGQDANSAS